MCSVVMWCVAWLVLIWILWFGSVLLLNCCFVVVGFTFALLVWLYFILVGYLVCGLRWLFGVFATSLNLGNFSLLDCWLLFTFCLLLCCFVLPIDYFIALLSWGLLTEYKITYVCVKWIAGYTGIGVLLLFWLVGWLYTCGFVVLLYLFVARMKVFCCIVYWLLWLIVDCWLFCVLITCVWDFCVYCVQLLLIVGLVWFRVFGVIWLLGS